MALKPSPAASLELYDHARPSNVHSKQMDNQSEPASHLNVEVQDEEPTPALYQSLPTPRHFRLLRLEAGQDEVHCRLHTFSLEESERRPSYRAVSYVWGEQLISFPRPINMSRDSQKSYKSTWQGSGNLYALLKQLKEPGTDCWLWIDALCINQVCTTEREQQVRLMGDIFKQANTVLAWLGPSIADKTSTRSNIESGLRALKYNHNQKDFLLTGFANILYNPDSEHWHGCRIDVQLLCQLPYWRRKWIVQELLLASTVVLQHGAEQCSLQALEDLCASATVLLTIEPDPHSSSPGPSRDWMDALMRTPAATSALRRRDRSTVPQVLKRLLVAFENQSCKEPCDHIYALYNLVGEHRRYLSVDYNRENIEHFRAAMIFMLEEEGMHVETVRTAGVLLSALGLDHPDVHKTIEFAPGSYFPSITTAVFEFTGLELEQESRMSEEWRDEVGVIPPLSEWKISQRGNQWHVMDRPLLTESPYPLDVSPCDLSFFRIIGTEIYGLASSRIMKNDRIWLFWDARLALVMQENDVDRLYVKGRAYLFHDQRRYFGSDLSTTTDEGASIGDENELSGYARPLEHEHAGVKRRNLKLELSILVTLAQWTCCCK